MSSWIAKAAGEEARAAQPSPSGVNRTVREALEAVTRL